MSIETGFSGGSFDCDRKGTGAAVDIGTTTVAAVFSDLATGSVLKIDSAVNPQISYGTDVISRIKYCSQYGVSDPKRSITDRINRMLEAFGQPLDAMSVTGNTAMLSMFTGEDPSSMGFYPFTPPSLFGETRSSESLGLVTGGEVYINPCMGPFVGGDITTAVLGSSLKSDDPALLCDIGTNGEVALFSNGRIYSASTAAGPAFEGATISCGMAAVSGALKKLRISSDGISWETTDGAEPKGICGSGLISAVSELLKNGYIDMTGLLEEEQFNITGRIYVNRKDIREIQMAKSAVCAGIEALCAKAGVAPSDIKTFCVAGGFGSSTDLSEAAAIGLFPKVLLPSAKTSGNAALGGCLRTLLSDSAKREAEETARNATVMNLAEDAVFMDKYIEDMFFEV